MRVESLDARYNDFGFSVQVYYLFNWFDWFNWFGLIQLIQPMKQIKLIQQMLEPLTPIIRTLFSNLLAKHNASWLFYTDGTTLEIDDRSALESGRLFSGCTLLYAGPLPAF